MQCLIAVGLGMVEPVSQTVGMGFIQLTYGHIYLEAFVYLLLAVVGSKDNPYGQDVVYLIEGYMLVLHLCPYGVGALDPLLNMVFDAHLVELLLDGLGKLVEETVARLLSRLQFLLNACILVGMLISETQVFEFGLYLV